MPAGSMTAAATNLSMFGLFLQADFVVKTVIIALALASVWTWAIIFEKVMLLRSATEDARKFEAQFWSGGSLDEMFDKLEAKPFRLDPMSSIFVAAMREWRRSSGVLGAGGVHGTSLNQRIDRVMQITMDREMDRMEKRMTFLASTGAVSPFIGLFGTVWGIMNSFHNIGASSNTSLAVVAPGIAEALFDSTGKYQTVQNAVYHHVETEKAGFLLLVLHVFKGIEARQNPNDVDYYGKKLTHGVNMEIEIQIFAEGKQHQLLVTAKYDAHTQCGSYGKAHTCEDKQNRSALKFPLYQNAKTQQNGEKNR